MKKAVFAAIVVGTLTPNFSEAGWLTRITSILKTGAAVDHTKISIYKILNGVDNAVLDTRASVMKQSKKGTVQDFRSDINIQDITVPDGRVNISVVSKRTGNLGPIRTYINVTTDSEIPELLNWMEDQLGKTLMAQPINTANVRRFEIDLSKQNKDRVRYTMNIFLQGIKKSGSETVKSRKNL